MKYHQDITVGKSTRGGRIDAHWLTFVLQGLRRKRRCRSAVSLARDDRHTLGMAIRAVHATRRDALENASSMPTT